MERLLLDACAVINLWAAGILEELTTSCGVELLVTANVASEAMYVEAHDPDGEREQIDWNHLQSSGTVTALELSGTAELTAFLGFIPRLGDGEAASLGMASSRGLIVATDDVLALKLAAEHDPVIVTVSTPEIVSFWADAAHVDRERVATAIARIEARARFSPAVSHPLARWWRDASSGP